MSDFIFGNDKQNTYAHDLIRKAETTASSVCAEVLGSIGSTTLSVTQASKVITYLQDRLGIARPTSEAANKPELLDLKASEIDLIVSGKAKRPEHLNEQSLKMLEAFERNIAIQYVIEHGLRGRNNRGPIKIADLIEHFGDLENLAQVFGVAVPTVKSWGEVLPANRMYEAEVKTKGVFKAPQ